jgi:hypothetical protein
MITLFTAPKPFEGHIGLIQRNALGSWLALGSQVEVLLVGDEPGMQEAARDLGIAHLREVQRNEYGTPLVSSIFALARQVASHSLLCYLNADVLLLDDFLPAVQRVAGRFDEFLIVGQRWDLDVREPLVFEGDWCARLRARLESQGRLHPPAGSDYFVFPRAAFAEMPPFALGRAGWDNWMIYAARHQGWPVVDATQAITVVHQDHDYAHLPGGQPHYRLPESGENVRLAGGREAIFTLQDATWRLRREGLQPIRWTERAPRRALEAALIAHFGPGRWARATRMLLHPWETAAYFCGAFLRRLRRAPLEEN